MIKGKELISKKIEDYIQDLINNGKIKPGDRLVPEQEIGKMFRASRVPVRKAMQKFIDLGMLEKIQGRGTFVKRVNKSAATNRVGIMYCFKQDGFFESPFFTAIMSGLEQQARQDNKALVISPLDSAAPGRAFHDMMEAVDGFILVDIMPNLFPDIESTLKKLKKPVVVLNYEALSSDIDSVVFDSYENTRMMMQFLVGLGHRRIGLVYHEPDDRPLASIPNHLKRIRAYRDVMAENGMAVDDNWRVHSESMERDPAVLKEVMSGPQAPTAFFCVDDERALRLYEAARRLGLRVPDDITVVGHDNIRESQTALPPLTTVHTSLLDMGMVGFERLLQKNAEQAKGVSSVRKIVLPGSIMERGSHRKLS